MIITSIFIGLGAFVAGVVLSPAVYAAIKRLTGIAGK